MSKDRRFNINLPGTSLLVILLFALAFCGEPDLHDAVIKKVMECDK